MVKQGSRKVTSGPRVKKLTRKQSRAKAKKETIRSKIPSSFWLTKQSLTHIRKFWKPLGGIVLVYLVLNAVFASGVGNINGNVQTIKSDLSSLGSGSNTVSSGISGFLQLSLSSGANGSTVGSSFQSALIIITSLTIIWALRQLIAGKKVTTKQAFYKSMTPLIPLLLVLVFILIQLAPLTIGSGIISSIYTSVGTVSGFWTTLFMFTLLLLTAWSLYMVCASLFAIYIVTLPDMQPRQALRSAKNLVRFRRLLVIRKILFLPLLLLLFSGAIIVPLILYATFLVTPVFYIFSMFSLLFIHTYFYNLYRSLLE